MRVNPTRNQSPTLPATDSAARAPTSAAELAPSGSATRLSSDAGVTGVPLASISTLADPFAMLAGLQSHLRNAQTSVNETGVQQSETQADAADKERARLLEKAERAARKATRGAPKWVKKLVGAILTIAGTVASVVTGGASLALVVAGALLMAAGEIVGQLAEKGVIDSDKGQWIAMALKLVGAIVMSVSGNGGSVADAAASVGQTAADVARAIEQVVRSVKALSDTVGAALEIRNGIWDHRMTKARLGADEQAETSEMSTEALDQFVEAIRRLHERYSRIAGKLHAAVDAQGEARLAAVGQRA